MTVSVGRPKGRGSQAARFYREILEEVAELDARDQTSLALAFTQGQPWEELPESLQALVSNLLEWVQRGR